MSGVEVHCASTWLMTAVLFAGRDDAPGHHADIQRWDRTLQRPPFPGLAVHPPEGHNHAILPEKRHGGHPDRPPACRNRDVSGRRREVLRGPLPGRDDHRSDRIGGSQGRELAADGRVPRRHRPDGPAQRPAKRRALHLHAAYLSGYGEPQ